MARDGVSVGKDDALPSSGRCQMRYPHRTRPTSLLTAFTTCWTLSLRATQAVRTKHAGYWMDRRRVHPPSRFGHTDQHATREQQATLDSRLSMPPSCLIMSSLKLIAAPPELEQVSFPDSLGHCTSPSRPARRAILHDISANLVEAQCHSGTQRARLFVSMGPLVCWWVDRVLK